MRLKARWGTETNFGNTLSNTVLERRGVREEFETRVFYLLIDITECVYLRYVTILFHDPSTAFGSNQNDTKFQVHIVPERFPRSYKISVVVPGSGSEGFKILNDYDGSG